MIKNIPLLQVVFSTIALLTSSALWAQVQFGVRAGANFSNVIAKDADGNKQTTSLLPGFHAGMTAAINITEDFFIQPGLLFSTKGYKYQQSQDGAKGTGTETPYYLELPVNLVFRPAIGKGRLLLGVGPYVGYGMGGKWKIAVAQGNSSLSQKGKLNFKNDMSQLYLDSTAGAFGLPETMTYAKPFDAGAAVLAGYELSNNLSFQLNGQLGLLNIQPTVSGRNTNMILKNMQFGVSVGYRF